jgi:outer membrane protein assembly factor BamB
MMAKQSGVIQFSYGRFIVSLLVVCGLNASVRSENWPGWRGPGMNGVSSETNLPIKWSETENIAWRAPVAGQGGSSPVVWGDVVIVSSQEGAGPIAGGDAHPLLSRDDRGLAAREREIEGRRSGPPPRRSGIFLIVEAFSRTTGNREKHNLATPTPITDGKLIFAWFGNGQVLALDMQGREVWRRHLGLEYGSFINNWGHGSSPALYKDSIILLCDHDSNAYLLSLDAATGKERWKVNRGRDRISHSTPFVYPAPAGDEMIINSAERIDAYNPSNGEFFWHAGTQRQTPIPTPVFHNGMIYMSRGYRNSDFYAIQPGGRGDVSNSHIKWKGEGAASYVPSILQYDGLLYMTNEVGVLTAADTRDGSRVWRQRLDGIFFASPVAGDGKVYLVSETGDTFVLKSGRTAELLSQNTLAERLIASPAISGGQIFLRSDRTLFCIGK